MKRNKFVVIGCGRFGGQVATERSEEGMQVIVVDAHEDSFRKLHETFAGYTEVGDATQLEILKKAFIEEAEYVLISTNRDNDNILIAHICDQIFQVPKIYIRLMDSEKEKLIDNERIQAIYPYNLSLDSFRTLFQSDIEDRS
ncbi:MAG: NAD-binding protein [Acholeplasmataceae bacterium]|jgi:trk system potassium uptake protein TrkA